VSYATSDETATASSDDYAATSGTLNWAYGDMAEKIISIPITNDRLSEGNETFLLALSTPTGGAAIGSISSAIVTIADDDPEPTVQFSSVGSSGNEETTPTPILVTLSAASGQTVTVTFLTADGTATAGSDYTAVSGTLTFDPGVTSRTINVPIIDDGVDEGSETFTVTILDPVNATLGTIATHTYTINPVGPPDLTLTAKDIRLASQNPDGTITIAADIYNQGFSTASNVLVRFYEFNSLLRETVLGGVSPNSVSTIYITVPTAGSGDRLIQVVIDPIDTIQEIDETNNEACSVIRVDSGEITEGYIFVTGVLPSFVYAGESFNINGHAAYDLYVGGVKNRDYVVKGGLVEITLEGPNGEEWIYGGFHTNIYGDFSRSLQAPPTPGYYPVIMTVSDSTFVGEIELVLTVVPRPINPPLPPPPPCDGCGGGGGGGGWTTPPGGPGVPCDTENECRYIPTPGTPPLPETGDLYIYSGNIHFSKNHPERGEEITIFAEVFYWAPRTTTFAQNIPVNLYVTYPGETRMKIGETVIDRITVGSPDYGSSFVFASWRNARDGIHIVEVDIDPSYIEENMLNNAATRAIIVGNIEPDHGAIEGQVIHGWGGFGNVIIELYDASGGALLQSRITDSTGYYLFELLPVGNYQVHIVEPQGYLADAETKPAEVIDQEIAVVVFILTEQQRPCGDLDHDWDVDGNDRNIIRGAFRTKIGDLGFIQEADYDGDGDIDYTDYQKWYECYQAFINR